MKANLDEVMVSARLPPSEEWSLDHAVETCWRCDEVRSIDLEDLVLLLMV
jgi:hypothetical protein